MDNKCISCGAIIPEGRLVCPICENIDKIDRKRSALKEYCLTTDCSKCLIKAKKGRCFQFRDATEDKLDEAISIIKKGR